jgi:hypothetical protein
MLFYSNPPQYSTFSQKPNLYLIRYVKSFVSGKWGNKSIRNPDRSAISNSQP